VIERKVAVRQSKIRHWLKIALVLAGAAGIGCQKQAAPPSGMGGQGLPVQTVTVSMSPVPQSSEYVSTI
jgi:hypothetical protein